ncbi:MAG TPA: hypothetical protein VMZ91_08795 [Candidatus Paceibacterota bacterium]|nr:hypothetical protein [Candidatus Paceibacterota bacterium]
MTGKKINKLFELANELYNEEHKKYGKFLYMPLAWARDNRNGHLIVISVDEESSQRIKENVEHLATKLCTEDMFKGY